MKVDLSALLVVVVLVPHASLALPALQPDWSWSWAKIPSWASGQGATDFAPNVTHYYADNFDIMWTQGANPKTRASKPPGYETWETGTASDCAKIHAVRPDMPTFGYYGFYGCCDAGSDNVWYPQFKTSNASSLWLRDDNSKIARYGDSPIYDLCEPRMMTFYKEVILADFMASKDFVAHFSTKPMLSLKAAAETILGARIIRGQVVSYAQTPAHTPFPMRGNPRFENVGCRRWRSS